MRVRIVRAHHGEVDGVPVADLVVGRTYDLAASIATYLIVMGSAETVVDQVITFPARSRQPKQLATTTGAARTTAVAADRPARVRDSQSRKPRRRINQGQYTQQAAAHRPYGVMGAGTADNLRDSCSRKHGQTSSISD